MSEQKPRTSQDVASESQQVQFKAGGLQYIIEMQTRDLKAFNDRLRDLAIEHNQLKAQEDKIVKALAEAKAEEVEKSKVEDNQASTQPGSEGPKPTPVGPDGQG